jgi:hypothetical protein
VQRTTIRAAGITAYPRGDAKRWRWKLRDWKTW